MKRKSAGKSVLTERGSAVKVDLSILRYWAVELALASCFLLAIAVIFPVAVSAQDYQSVISPLVVDPDHNGVNIADGKIHFEVPTLSVPADPRLKFDWVQNSAPYVTGKGTATDIGGDTPSQWSYSVHTGADESETFSCVDTDCTSVTASGSTFNVARVMMQGGTGTRYYFHDKYVDVVGSPSFKIYYATSVWYQDGERISYSYDTSTVPSGYILHRTNAMSSNLGYCITISYRSSDNSSNDWNAPSQVKLFKCSDPSTLLGSLTYAADGSITDLAGRVYHCNFCSNSLGSPIEVPSGSMELPGESGNARQVTALANPPCCGTGLVGSVVNDGVAWNYGYTNLTYETSDGRTFIGKYHYDYVTVSGPNSYSKRYNIAIGDVPSGKPNYITSIVDELNRTTSYQYYEYRPSLITYPEGNSVSITYDDYGNIRNKTMKAKPGSGLADISETTFIDETTCASSYAVLCYRPVWYKDGLGRETDYVYNNQGQVTQQTDPADASGVRRATYTSYDAHVAAGGATLYRKNVVRLCGIGTTCGTNAEIRTEYDYWGDTFLPSAKREIDAAAGITLTTTYTYDNAGRLLVEDGPLAGTGDAKYYRYDILGRKTWEIGPVGTGGVRVATRTTYRDADDKVTLIETGTVTDPNSTTLTVTSQVATTYDTRRNPIRATMTASGTTMSVADQSFDDRGEQLCATTRMNFASLPADACTLGTAGSYGQDRIVHNVYDAAGQLLKTQKAYGTSLAQDFVTYTYTPNGKQQYVTDADGNKAQFAYDGFDRLQRWYFPSATTAGTVNTADYEEYGYDAAGNRTSLRKRDGRTFTFTIDGLNRITKKVVPDGCAPVQSGACPAASATRDVFYGYDVRGLQLYARFDSATGDGVTNSYDGFGRLTSSTTAMSGTSRKLSYAYDADGNRTKVTYPDSVYFTATYDTADHLLQMLDQSSAQLTLMGYDGLGRRTSDFAGAETYGYDGANRLTSQGVAYSKSYDVARTFGYNPASQIVSQTRSNDGYAFGYTNVSRTYAKNGLNQYTSAGPATFGYDADGNLISDGSATYGYDGENRLISCSTGAALVYDPLGRLWQTSGGSAGITQFLYDGDALVGEYNSSGTLLRRYVHGADAGDDPVVWYEGSGVTAAQRRLMLADHQGSIDLVIDGSNNQVAINAYDNYGIPKLGNVGRFQYTGQAWIPELGMYYYKARIYSPTLGRFMQTDPIGYKDQVNLYAYVANDPVNHVDPSGEAIVDVDPKTRQELQGLINSVSKTQYSFDKNGSLHADSSLGINKKGSRFYSSQLNKGIAGKETITAAKSQTMSYTTKGSGALEGVQFRYNLDVDKQGGGGLTSPDGHQVAITGHSTSDHGVAISPAMTLAHELAAHAIPKLYGGVTGNAITDENIIRGQIGLPLRPADPSHTECYCNE